MVSPNILVLFGVTRGIKPGWLCASFSPFFPFGLFFRLHALGRLDGPVNPPPSPKSPSSYPPSFRTTFAPFIIFRIRFKTISSPWTTPILLYRSGVFFMGLVSLSFFMDPLPGPPLWTLNFCRRSIFLLAFALPRPLFFFSRRPHKLCLGIPIPFRGFFPFKRGKPGVHGTRSTSLVFGQKKNRPSPLWVALQRNPPLKRPKGCLTCSQRIKMYPVGQVGRECAKGGRTQNLPFPSLRPNPGGRCLKTSKVLRCVFFGVLTFETFFFVPAGETSVRGPPEFPTPPQLTR